jgi:membrane protein
MVAGVIELGRSWATRFVEVQGVDRAMALAAQAFSALIPLLLVYTSVLSRSDGSRFAENLIDRFELDDATADSVREAFASSETVASSISLLGIVLVVIAALSFTRGMQRLYENTYGLTALGMRNTPWALAWLGLLVIWSSLQPVLASVFTAVVPHAVVSLALAAAAWLATPYLLLGRRLRWQKLMTCALVTAVGMTALGATSVYWFPRTIETSADQFGVIGVAFAMLSWLVAAGFVLVIAATGGAVTADAVQRRGRDSNPR